MLASSTPWLPSPPQPPRQRSEPAAGVEPPRTRGVWRSPCRRAEHRRAERLRERSWVRRSAGVAAGGAFPRRGGGGGDAAPLLPFPRLLLQLLRPTPAAAWGRRGGGSRRPRRLPAARPDAASSLRAPVAGPGLQTSR